MEKRRSTAAISDFPYILEAAGENVGISFYLLYLGLPSFVDYQRYLRTFLLSAVCLNSSILFYKSILLEYSSNILEN